MIPKPNPNRTEEEIQRIAAQTDGREAVAATTDAQRRGHSMGALLDAINEEDPKELFDRLVDPDVESGEFEDLEAELKPLLSYALMLADHGDDYYDDLDRELLNANVADRVITNRERGRLLTGPFLEVAQEVEGDRGDLKRPYSPWLREGVRLTIEDVRTARQSLGDGSLLKALMEIHVSSEVNRPGGPDLEKKGGILSTLNPFN